ncbi:cytochrome P450 4g15 [Bacillus rossius redtenbacheri]|uniref:cytochrome P450 4g15 n=1 Tax=Bacillus rossius redtenbacheri TaxID=93214 RepID=UPI002FDEBA96
MDASASPLQHAQAAVFFALLLPAAALLAAHLLLRRRRGFVRLAERLPGPPGYPLIGNALEFVGKADQVFDKMSAHGDKYSTVMKVWVGPKLMVFLSDPRDVEIILGSSVYIDKSTEYRFFKPWLGEGLLISSGSKWRAHRKLIAPTFHLNVLKSFVELFNANSEAVARKMAREEGREFDVHDYMSECTVEILLETAMGVSKKTQDKSGFEYAMAVMRMCDILHLRHTKVWLRPDWLFNLTRYGKHQTYLLDIIHGLTKKVIQKKKEEFGQGQKRYISGDSGDSGDSAGPAPGTPAPGLRDDLDEQDENDVGQKKRLAFLDLMLESAQNGTSLTDEEIKEEVDTIMFEGHDTTAACSSFFLSLMGIHQHIQDKVHEELQDIFKDSGRPVSYQDTLDMKYLERCILETLRLYPPVPVIARQLQENLKLASGDYVVPAGATVVVTTFKVHRRADIYPDPLTFDPDNFLPERMSKRHYYSFIPFSAGPRSCVGRKYAMLKLKVILATVLRKYRVHSSLKEQDFRLQADIILKRAEGFRIRLEPRAEAKTKTQ